MKNFMKFAITAILAVTVLALAACSNYGSIKKVYEKEGYEQSEEFEEMYANFYAAFVDEETEEEYGVKINIHILIKDADRIPEIFPDFAIIIEFDCSEKKMKEYMEDEDIKDAYDEARKKGYIKGTCVLVYGSDDALEIWEKI